MDDDIKIRLMELALGLQEPISGIEKHFLKVIKNEALACTLEEKEWYEWWITIQKSSKIPKNNNLASRTQEKSKVLKEENPKSSDEKYIENKKMPKRVYESVNKIAANAPRSSDMLDSNKRLQGSYGSGKKR